MWNCRRKTKNMTRICDACWKDRENIYLAHKANDWALEGERKVINRSPASSSSQRESRQITEAIAPHGHFSLKSYVEVRLHAVRPPILKALPDLDRSLVTRRVSF